MELLHSGKVRDVYVDGDDLILVASDRVSVYDVVLPTPIPDKGAILTQLSLWWFEHLADILPNHVISATDVPDQWRGRAIRCRRLEMVKVECVARGYLTGGAMQEYLTHGRGLRHRPAARAAGGRPPAGADLHADHEGSPRPARRVHDVRPGGGPGGRGHRRGACGRSRSRSTGAGPRSPPSTA